jgi:hypothetical protein
MLICAPPPAAEPRHHRPIDFWVLLLLWQRGGCPAPGGPGGGGNAAARGAEALLRRKLLEGRANLRWIETGVKDHQVRWELAFALLAGMLSCGCSHSMHRNCRAPQAVAQELWQPLTALAAAWSRAREAPVRLAAGRLYRALFVAVDSTLHRQEVLQVRLLRLKEVASPGVYAACSTHGG